MKNKQLFLLFIVLVICGISSSAQNHKYYVRAISQDFNPDLYSEGTSLKYKGTNINLKELFENNNIFVFEKAFPSTISKYFIRYYYIESDTPDMLSDLVRLGKDHFEFTEYIGNDEIELLNSYPNDYGNTSPLPSTGLPVNLIYLDFANTPLAWDYTTGSSNTKVGISDGKLVYYDDVEFENKIEYFNDNYTSCYPIENCYKHGVTITAIAAAQGDNGEGITGVCYDCDIIKTGVGYDEILALAEAGADVINCSWASTYNSIAQQEVIDSVTIYHKSIVVAASGNKSWNTYPGNLLYYPASYNNVISVAAVSHIRNIEDVDCSDVLYTDTNIPYLTNIRGFIGTNIGFQGNTVNCLLPLADQINSYVWSASTSTLNSEVDILAPSGGIFSYGAHLVNGVLEYTDETGLPTSPAAPQVTGTIGLMLDLRPCLPFIEVESILKISSLNFDDIPQNSVQLDNWGSGGLQTGAAVKLTHDLMTPSETAYLKNQKFNRWDFVFNGVSENIIIRNQEFTEISTLTVTAKNVITIEEETLLEPNQTGFAILEINPNLIIQDNCKLDTSGSKPTKNNFKEMNNVDLYNVIPTIVESNTTISKIEENGEKISEIFVYNILGIQVYNVKNINTYRFDINLSNLTTGIYIIKAMNNNNKVLFTEKIVKK